MTTKTSTAKTSTTTTKAPAVALSALVEAFHTAETKASGYSKDLDFLQVQLGTARVMAARVAVAIFRHPEVGGKYQTAAKAVGIARNTLRPYIDGGLSLSAARLKATDVTPADIKKVGTQWETAAAKKTTTRAARPEGVKGEGTTTPAEGESAESVGLPTVTPAAPVTFKDVQDGVKALRELVKSYRATGAMTEKEIRGLGVQLANVAKLASTGE
jgi:hypothetical protein